MKQIIFTAVSHVWLIPVLLSWRLTAAPNNHPFKSEETALPYVADVC